MIGFWEKKYEKVTGTHWEFDDEICLCHGNLFNAIFLVSLNFVEMLR